MARAARAQPREIPSPEHRAPSPPGSERAERKRQLLTRASPASTRGIADALVLKDGDLFLASARDGAIPLDAKHGFGLYHHDCRYLDGYALTVEGTPLEPLATNTEPGFKAIVELTNREVRTRGGAQLDAHEIGVRLDRLLDGRALALHDVLTVRSYAARPLTFTIALELRAGFRDVYEVRGLMQGRRGVLHEPTWGGHVLSFAYDGVDGERRRVQVRFWRAPDATSGARAEFSLSLGPEQEERIALTVTLGEGEDEEPASTRRPALGELERRLRDTTASWRDDRPRIATSSDLVARVLERSLLDLRMLRTEREGDRFYAAGVPWYVALFGRDSLIAALEALAFEPAVAASTLRLLARHRGRAVDLWRDEQPGKILHELRVGELARAQEVPHTPYYGSVDATPLFLVLLARHAAWTGDLSLFHELREAVDAALGWMGSWGDPDDDGYLEYQSDTASVNQGWKDSGDAIPTPEGRLATPPITLCEVQGYVYLAKMEIAPLFERAGERALAAELRDEAHALRARWNDDFWMPGPRFFALALEAGDAMVGSIASNAGQALWTGIVDAEKARPTIARLMSPDMYSGWGIRTLSEGERRYNPIAYHRGTVWPHDNALIAAGMRRYGCDAEACRVFEGLAEAARRFPSYRLPEVFCGFSRADYGVPVHYPVACHPQAWAAGAMPYLLVSLLGLAPAAFERRLCVVRPVLPALVPDVALHGVRIGNARVDLGFRRRPDGTAEVTVLDVDGELDVVVKEASVPALDAKRSADDASWAGPEPPGRPTGGPTPRRKPTRP
jgi:glycogen debranching enzyme